MIASAVVLVAVIVFTSYISSLRNKSFSVDEEASLTSTQIRLITFAKSNNGKAFIIVMWVLIGLVLGVSGLCWFRGTKALPRLPSL